MSQELADTPKQDARPIRIGIVGFGHIGRHHLKATVANPNLETRAIADPGNFDRSSLPETVTVYAEWQDMLGQPDLDAISVCVPHDLHLPITLAALAAGKHVMIEKPLALTAEEGETLIAAAKEQGRTIMVELTHRFYPALRQARAFVEAGHLGSVYAVEDRIVETAGSQIQPWLKTKALAGGGVALTNGVHMLDRMAFVTGQKLTFQSGVAGYTGQLGDVEDTAAMQLTLENGAPAQLLASWPAGSSGTDDELTVYGTKGTLRVHAWNGWRFDPLDAAEAAQDHPCYTPEDDIQVRIQSGVYGALAEFADAIIENRQPNPPAEAALASQQIIEQFYRYVEERRS